MFQYTNCIGLMHQISGFLKLHIPKLGLFPIKSQETTNCQKSFYNYDFSDILKDCQENEVGNICYNFLFKGVKCIIMNFR